MSDTYGLGASFSAPPLRSRAMKGGHLTSVRLGLSICKVGTEVTPTSEGGL